MSNFNKVILLLMFSLFLPNYSLGGESSDAYICGYVQSIFINDYRLPAEAVRVKRGIIFIDEGQITNPNPTQVLEKVKQATGHLDKVVNVKLEKRPFKAQHYSKEQKRIIVDGALPNHSLFEPLIADPKWPRFTLAYHYYMKDRATKHAFSPNFGASFALYRDYYKEYEWEIGVQAGLFGMFDIGVSPSALINADYFVGVPLSFNSGSWSGLVRPYHISTHLGDEFMLTNEGKKVKRINLSYEGVDLIFSYNFANIRLYGGGGYLVHREPREYKPLKLQMGTEYYSPSAFWNGRLRPVLAIDVKAEEHGDWYPGVSCKGGVQLENSYLTSSKVQLMLEFYSGRSMHGQFYRDKIRYLGLGLHAFL